MKYLDEYRDTEAARKLTAAIARTVTRPCRSRTNVPRSARSARPRRRWVGEGDVRNCLGKLNDPGKPALRRLGILPQQLRTSPLFAQLLRRKLHEMLIAARARLEGRPSGRGEGN
jgi:hypothetical protein